MTINKKQKIKFLTVKATESECQVLRDLYNACVEVSEDNDVYASLEEILETTISELIQSGVSDLSYYYDN